MLLHHNPQFAAHLKYRSSKVGELIGGEVVVLLGLVLVVPATDEVVVYHELYVGKAQIVYLHIELPDKLSADAENELVELHARSRHFEEPDQQYSILLAVELQQHGFEVTDLSLVLAINLLLYELLQSAIAAQLLDARGKH